MSKVTGDARHDRHGTPEALLVVVPIVAVIAALVISSVWQVLQ